MIVGAVNRDKAWQKWHNEPDEYHLLNAASLLDWVMMGVLAGGIRPRLIWSWMILTLFTIRRINSPKKWIRKIYQTQLMSH